MLTTNLSRYIKDSLEKTIIYQLCPPLASGGRGTSDFFKTSKGQGMVGCKILILKGELAQKGWGG